MTQLLLLSVHGLDTTNIWVYLYLFSCLVYWVVFSIFFYIISCTMHLHLYMDTMCTFTFMSLPLHPIHLRFLYQKPTPRTQGVASSTSYNFPWQHWDHLYVNPVFQSHIKIVIDYNFVRNHVTSGFSIFSYIFSNDQLAGTLTKPFSTAKFKQVLPKIGILNLTKN